MQSALINVMSGAALKAGKGLLRDFGEVDQLQVSRKGPANFVTKTDIRTEKLLHRELSAARPGYGFLLEEGGEIAGTDGVHRFIIDPLDGTSNFIHAIPYFCISIGVEQRQNGKSEIIAGVIYDPIHNELFTAEKNKGAFLNSRRLVVSGRDKIEDSLLVTGNHRLLDDNQRKSAIALTETICQKSAIIRTFGATALDLAYVAAGRIDACWFHMAKPWDIAAGMLLVQEAGGSVSLFDGKPADAYATSLLASNGHLAQPMQQLLAAR